MGESILLGLISSLSSVLFSSILQEPKNLTIEGSPTWYGKYDNKEHIIAYGYSNEEKDFLQFSKSDCKKSMIMEIENILNKSISKNQRNLDNEFNELKTNYLENQNYEYFFKKELKFEKISHEFDNNQTFSKCVVDKKSFLIYQEEIIKGFSKDYSFYKMDKRQIELENEVKKL